MLKVERIPEVYLQHIIKSHIFFLYKTPVQLTVTYSLWRNVNGNEVEMSSRCSGVTLQRSIDSLSLAHLRSGVRKYY